LNSYKLGDYKIWYTRRAVVDPSATSHVITDWMWWEWGQGRYGCTCTCVAVHAQLTGWGAIWRKLQLGRGSIVIGQ